MKRLLSSLIVVGVFAGCQTMKKEEAETPPPPPAEFMPQLHVSPIHVGQGRYPGLYATESQAVWVDSAVTEHKLALELQEGVQVDETLKRDAASINQNYIIIECHLQSMFGDSSIAYDVVWFRGVEVALELPDGTKVAPSIVIEGRTVEESPEGALVRYARSNLLLFPKRDVFTQNILIDANTPGVKLVLEGFNTSFFFQWDATPQPEVAPESWVPGAMEKAQLAKVKFTEMFDAVRELAHNFD